MLKEYLCGVMITSVDTKSRPYQIRLRVDNYTELQSVQIRNASPVSTMLWFALLFVVVLADKPTQPGRILPAGSEELTSQVRDVQCPGGSQSCPSGFTCCPITSTKFGCCPQNHAVCCSDHIHCCPANTTCNLSAGTCDRKMTHVEFRSLKKLVDKPRCGLSDPCDGGLEDASCCEVVNRKRMCCPHTNGECCGDGRNCCPSNYRCDLEYGRCVKKGGIPMQRKLPAKSTTSLRDVQCPDHSSSCPQGTTCCAISNGKYGCCPYPNATCCSDKIHCCPHGMRCDVRSSQCLREGAEDRYESESEGRSSEDNSQSEEHFSEDVIELHSAQHPPCLQKCWPGTTCCRYPNVGRGTELHCCAAGSLCCADKITCCPSSMECANDGTGSCRKARRNYVDF